MAPKIPSMIVNPTKRPQYKFVKALFPYMSAEDQAALGASYGLAPAMPPAGQLTTEERNRLVGSERAEAALMALESARVRSKRPATNPSMVFLNQVIGLLKKYGGEEGMGMSRENFNLFSTAFSGLMEQAKENKIPAFWRNMASTFSYPTTPKGSALMPTSRFGTKTVAGSPSNKLY